MRDEALKLADELEASHQYVPSKAPAMIRRLVEERDMLIKTVEEIANDYPELSYDKARMQNLDHIKWAKNVLKEIE